MGIIYTLPKELFQDFEICVTYLAEYFGLKSCLVSDSSTEFQHFIFLKPKVKKGTSVKGPKSLTHNLEIQSFENLVFHNLYGGKLT